MFTNHNVVVAHKTITFAELQTAQTVMPGKPESSLFLVQLSVCF